MQQSSNAAERLGTDAIDFMTYDGATEYQRADDLKRVFWEEAGAQ